MAALTLFVNGSKRSLEVDPDRPLLGVLREELDLTGTKYGCGEGQCGACTVLVDGEATRSCVTAVGQVRGRKIVTIEGLEQGGRLHPVQQAFLDADAMQCGYCTPGMILASVAFLAKNRDPSEADIVASLDNVCRCGTYTRIAAAVKMAATSRRG